jgi:hypothetical protein
MKVEGPGKSQSASGSKKKDKVSSGDGSFGDLVTGGADKAESAGSTQSIAQVDALLAVQQTDDPAQRAARGRMRARAHSLLDGLERIRVSLLTGNLTVGDVIDIADVVASHREKITDPELTAILDEIDLRAQIELAKMRMALRDKG